MSAEVTNLFENADPIVPIGASGQSVDRPLPTIGNLVLQQRTPTSQASIAALADEIAQAGDEIRALAQRLWVNRLVLGRLNAQYKITFDELMLSLTTEERRSASNEQLRIAKVHEKMEHKYPGMILERALLTVLVEADASLFQMIRSQLTACQSVGKIIGVLEDPTRF